MICSSWLPALLNWTWEVTLVSYMIGKEMKSMTWKMVSLFKMHLDRSIQHMNLLNFHKSHLILWWPCINPHFAYQCVIVVRLYAIYAFMQNYSGEWWDSISLTQATPPISKLRAWSTSKWSCGRLNELLFILAPVLDACLQTWTTPVLGPIWVSKGEGFSPKGVLEFLKGLINYTNSKLKEAKHYKQQLHFAKRDEDRENVEIAAILSMSPAEIDETLEIVST